MAIVKQGSVTLNSGAKGDKGDAGTGGASSPDIVVVTNLLELQAVGVDKIASIQADINTGVTNIAMAANTIIQFDGGSLTGTGTITGNLTDIRGAIIDESYFNGYVFNGTWKVTSISFNWFGLISDATSTKFNNRQAVKNALYVANSSGHCDVNWYNNEPNSEWFVDCLDTGYASGIDDNVNYGIYNTTNVHLIGHNFPKIHVLDNNVDAGHSLRNMIFQTFEAKYCSISGFELIGDRQTATLLGEHKMGITISNNSDHTKVFNNRIHNFSGDGIYFQNQQYSGYGQIPTQSDSEWTTGAVDGTTGLLDVAENEYMSSNAFLDIDTPLFQDRGYLYVTGRMEVENYFISFYDDQVGTTFLGKTKALEAYDRVYFPEGTKSIKLTMWYEAALDTARPINVNNYDYSRYVTIENNDIHHCSRQGLSNAPAYTRIHNNKFSYIFGQTAGPCAGIDLEDGTYFTAYVEIHNNTFLNNSGGGILLKYNRHCSVKDNWFGSTDVVDYLGYTLYGNFTNGYYGQFSPGTIVSGNTFVGQASVIGRDQTYTGNYLKNTTISLEKGSSNVFGNTGVNVQIISVNDTYSFEGRPKFHNNSFVWDKAFNWELDASYGFSVFGRYDEDYNSYDFKGASESVARSIVLKGAGANADSGTGYINGMRLNGFLGSASYGFGGYGNVNISNSYFSCGFKERDDVSTPRDVTHTNVHFKNYIELDLRSYTIANIPTLADYPTYTFSGGSVIKEDVSVASEILDVKTGDKNRFHLVFKDFTFKSLVDINTTKSFIIGNTGTVHFINCTFDFATAEVYDFADSLTTKGFMINCTLNNFTVTPRVGDVMQNNLIDGVWTP